MPKLSIIIPMYNAEDYIGKCLDSIRNLTFQDYEVICVDDGSADRTLSVCKRYQSQDKRLHIVSSFHSGVSKARNIGIGESRGEYIAFIDSDDYIEDSMYEDMICQLDITKADVAVSDFYIDTGMESRIRKNERVVLPVFDGKQLLKYAFEREHYHGITAWLWNKVFRKSIIIKDEPIQFEENLEIGEDVVFIVKFALRTYKAIHVEKAFYHHVNRENSLSKEYNSKKYNDRLLAYKMAIQILKENGITEETAIWLKRFYVYHAANFVESAKREGDWYHEHSHKKDIKTYLNEYIRTNQRYPERIKRIYELLD
ncbi:glycosyltransferase family 2 protein [Anaerocolumna xylanovorans]|uniref:Glycosyl transferase family 2 n=1 Tax=Anaerocolumna xylanovorans DSM 12503 TaxID=1121345 RepID=A0A1M7Y826_9FIRM|nr:glycosyltransferase family 2 protein [Anaerocolumna xylanovorans]SHO48783.1 Glycosyl transferase family 2 [Anaerocolumna xylanovorans DSM 12503]